MTFNSAPLIVTGMHRSGTSLMTAVVGALGVDLGDRLLGGDIHNAKGYFEDVDFLEFQRKILQDRSPQGDEGWPDWGWTEQETLNLESLKPYQSEAEQLLATRSGQVIWGWKDPRTTLLLDFWSELLPQARYLLVYRFPWDVADSVMRVNHPTFVAKPDYALRSWYFYNRSLLDFYLRHRNSSVLVNVNAFLEQPQVGLELLAQKFSLNYDSHRQQSMADIYDPQLFSTLGWDYPLARSLYTVSPHYFALLKALDQAADLAGDCPEWVTVKPSLEPRTLTPGDVPPERAILSLHRCIIDNNLRHQGEVQQLQLAMDRLRQQLEESQQSMTTVQSPPSKRQRLAQLWRRLRSSDS
ncbi:MAG: sulfotransferase family protein [Oscillatoriales cyanobacterium]|nr:MAG: sulfotransferase family protein [Oscillatoriales cyanobacterium]